MIADKSSRAFRPEHIVHICFAIVFVFSTLLTWREAQVLKSSYETDQRAWLAQLASGLEHQLQQSIDEMYFFRNMLHHALDEPLVTDKSREALAAFAVKRHHPLWKININSERSMPLNGISDEALQSFPLLSRADPKRLDDELTAVLEMSYILQFNNPVSDLHYRLWYISRAGFYLSSVQDDKQETVKSYSTAIDRPYFLNAHPQSNPDRGMRWSESYHSLYNEGEVVTVTLPVDHDNYWYGELAMDFSTEAIQRYLRQTLPTWQAGHVMLFDRKHKPLAISDGKKMSEQGINSAELAEIFNKRPDEKSGQIRSGTRFITWVRLQHFDGMMINVQTLDEGMRGETGRVTLVLVLMWGLFTLVLLACHQAIFRMIRRMLSLQEALKRRANYDGLTRQLNRSAFFEQARKQSAFCERHQLPLSLIQLDLDHFKSVNDTWGHHAGDVVLTHAASVIARTLRKEDVLGRVGGEEFCVVLPDTSLAEAVEIAERIRCKLASKEVLINAMKTLKVTASLGVSSSDEQQDYKIENLQSIADERLYRAKQAGRNCVSSGG
ncbi:cellulose biosynthesis regulator diguanylate cyclase DgcQ [Erwinia sorbitola]|uniref:diguanylate cyclase n=1 Tax=Erwinia sorbitola TaxID=2681984 RepID=A0ABW9R5S3_9GAMM|nr:cellulose biosynthesis regulator diguanylate cyclase DgcQ [Erwinia sorbitola]MTD25434.1 cellulose biosynthesis regulator YedQ [Erwinia sorbitola]